jgi:hypothetical protein
MSDDTFTPATLLTGQRLIDPSLREPQLERSVCDLGAAQPQPMMVSGRTMRNARSPAAVSST